MPTRFDSVIFDLDGTLWDASAAITRAFQAARNSVDYIDNDVTLAQVQAVTGQPYEVVYERLFPNLPADKFDEYRALCARQELAAAQQHGGTLYPGLEAALAYLRGRGYRLFIVSNCQLGYVEAFLNAAAWAITLKGTSASVPKSCLSPRTFGK
ncbi:HAD family hydrolase [Hymenobacter humi]|uniref:phosphoglycolate phosphatase n=1 Tax=Hymenobacter humi TaxID=1411620 RepID=A0ABW2U244_9BACT